MRPYRHTNEHRAMKSFSVVVSATAIVAGVGGGAVAFQAMSSTPETAAVAKTTTHQAPAPQVTRPGVTFRFAPCKAPAKRVGKACVVDVVQTVVLPAAPAPSSTYSHDSDQPAQHSPSSHEGHHNTPSTTHDDSTDESEPEADDHGDDHDGEDHGDEPGDDGGHEPGDD